MEEINGSKEIFEEDPQIAENDLDSLDLDDKEYYATKREKLKTLGIVKQSWSVGEIIDKLANKIFLMDPSYQRSLTWNKEKKDSFIESLFMRIVVPPIYLAEIRVKGRTIYEVVDGKQRLSTLHEFITDHKYCLNKKNMDYFDSFDGMSFDSIYKTNQELADEMLSHTLDCYVITTKTDEEIKYDIFSRINKGAVVLTPDEIRVALYNSPLLEFIKKYIEEISFTKDYLDIFTKQAIKKKKDLGRFFRSIAFAYFVHEVGDERIAYDYRSRPKDFINKVLLKFKKDTTFVKEEIMKIINLTIYASAVLLEHPEISKDYYIDALLSIFKNIELKDVKPVINDLLNSKEFGDTLTISPATTSNVNKRLNYMKKFVINHD